MPDLRAGRERFYREHLDSGGNAYETSEGHVVECDERGALTSIEFLNVRWLLQRDGEFRVTLSEKPAVATSRELETLLA